MKFKKLPNPKPQHPKDFFLGGIEFRFVLIFLLLFFALQYGYSASRGGIVEHWVIDLATVQPSTAVINLIVPDSHAQSSGHRIVSPHGSISILNGCEGTETMFLLLAAMVAFNAPWKQKLKGVLLGMLMIYGLNQVRIIALFFAAQQDRKWFDMLHGIIAPTLIIVLSVLFFLWWTSSNTTGGNEQTSTA